MHLGDSSKILADVISPIDRRITFWLDAHVNDFGMAVDYDKTPVMKELEIIANHPIKNHTVLIDDIEYCEQFGTSIDEITEVLTAINSEYLIEIQKLKMSVLIAQVQ